MIRPGKRGRIILGVGAMLAFPGVYVVLALAWQLVKRSHGSAGAEGGQMAAAILLVSFLLSIVAMIAYAVAFVITSRGVSLLGKIVWVGALLGPWFFSLPAFYLAFIIRDKPPAVSDEKPTNEDAAAPQLAAFAETPVEAAV